MGSLKQFILIRKDKKYSMGKIIAHAAHASIIAFDKTIRSNEERYEDWFLSGNMTKVVLEVDSLDCLLKYEKICTEEGIAFGMIEDAGYYETPPGEIICCAIGPIIPQEYERLKLKNWKLFK